MKQYVKNGKIRKENNELFKRAAFTRSVKEGTIQEKYSSDRLQLIGHNHKANVLSLYARLHSIQKWGLCGWISPFVAGSNPALGSMTDPKQLMGF